jgi:exodeoxyribonuclease VII large subunit
MSETIAGRKVFSLSEVGMSIQRTLKERYSSRFWVRAELHKLNYYSHSGHAYPELVEKSEGKIIAQFRSLIWKSDYDRINTAFIKMLKEPLREGITILFEASVQYDPLYDLSLRIYDIDPSYALGELERERVENLERLKKEGIFGKNKLIPFPLIPQRLAVISVETSKGYADFLKVIDQNPWGYKYFHFLFPALLQGEKAAGSIMAAFEKISRVKNHFDLVLIIRGGGGDIGLSCYNNYELAKTIAMFPLPVLAGVGHATNETISELVSYRHFITPTEAATFLLQSFHNVSVPLQKAETYISQFLPAFVRQQQQQLIGLTRYFAMSVKNCLQEQQQITSQAPLRIQTAMKSGNRASIQELESLKFRINNSALGAIKNQVQQLTAFEKQTNMLDPELILKRGFSITLYKGKALNNAENVEPGDQIETILFRGRIKSRIEPHSKTKSDE